MDPKHTKPYSNTRQQQPLFLKGQGKQPRSIQKRQTVRKSSRLHAKQQLRKQSRSGSDLTQGLQAPPSSPTTNIPKAGRAPTHLQILDKPSEAPRKQIRKRKRKREQEAGPSSHEDREQLRPKQPWTSPASHILKGKLLLEASSDASGSSPDPLLYWIRKGRWRKEYFEQDSRVRVDFERGRSLESSELEGSKEPSGPMQGFHHLQHLFARKTSSSSLRRKKTESSLHTPSDQLPREVRSAQYRAVEYEIGLEKKGSYMREFKGADTPETITILCKNLLESVQTYPQDSLFRNDRFKNTCENIRNRNETMVIRDIGLLIVPSAQTLATYGATHLSHLHECVNEGWNSAIPFHGTRPQPDFSVGFGRSAFSEQQLKKLEPFVGEIESNITTFFMATTRMFFPFLTCEVKCGAAELEVADRQNAHSMTIAVKGIVELFKAVKRQEELHQEILAFSISHDHRSVRIYGHYAIIEKDQATFYRHPIHEFNFTSLDGKEKWTSYQFTKNIYDIWLPIQHKRICSAIDELPSDLDFDLSQSASFSYSGSQRSEAESLPSIAGSQEVTPTTSFTQQPSERASKKPRNQQAA